MELADNAAFLASLRLLQQCALLTAPEVACCCRLADPASPFAHEVALAETLHLHIKVDDTHQLPLNAFFAAGARLDHQKDGFVKYLFPGGLNAIFSHIAVSQDELLETAATRRSRPFLDHIGVDLRAETAPVRAAFAELPALAARLTWRHVAQGSPERPVYCCHVEVAQKHWLYPPDEAGHPGIPLEFAYGALKVNPGKMGCDLRPADPANGAAADLPCGSTPPAETTPLPAAATATAGSGYYQPQDLGRFGEISRVNPALGAGFFAYYNQVMAAGRLTKREKALIALAVAHAQKCPYCIDAYTTTLYQLGVGEPEMSEAVHVAATMVAGITLVHSVQLMHKVDQLAAPQRAQPAVPAHSH